MLLCLRNVTGYHVHVFTLNSLAIPLHFLGVYIPTVSLLKVVVDRAARVSGVGSTIVIRVNWMRPENFDHAV